MGKATFQNLLSRLGGEQPPRVWSLLVTVFGDMAQEPGAQISGATLSQICALIGIKPEAMRVALHRLRKDGWIDSHRNGRSSTYFLTAFGRAQSAAATPRIYAPKPLENTAWLLVWNPALPADGDRDRPGVWLASNLQISAKPPKSASCLATEIAPGTRLPGWIGAKLCSAELAVLCQQFCNDMQDVQDALPSAKMLSPVEVAALRVMVVHTWRRIVLRAPALPDHVMPDHWAGPACRTEVASLLRKYPRPSLADLDAAA